MAGQVRSQQHVADAWLVGLGRVHQVRQQLGQMPRAAKRQLQVDQLDTQHLLLCHRAAQAAIIFLQIADIDGQLRGEAPQQNFGEVMQQRGNGHFFDVDVLPPHCPLAGIVGGTLHATDELQRAEHGLWFGLEHLLDGDQILELFEERLDANHHYRTGDGGDFRTQALAGKGLDIGEDLDCHQRVLQHHVGNVAAIDAVDLLSHLVEFAGGVAKHGQVGTAEKQQPGFEILQGVGQHRFAFINFTMRMRKRR